MDGPARKVRAAAPDEGVRDPFLNHTRVQAALPALDALAGRLASGDKVVSGLRHEGLSYVDLVVEGGGVLGIALVGYTWALERAGIRFRHLGGASAGAIVALLLAALGPKEEAKSGKLVEELASFDLATLEDGDLPSRLFGLVRRAGTAGRIAMAAALGLLFFGPVVLGALLGPPLGLLPLAGWGAVVLAVAGLAFVVLRRRGVNSGTAFTAWMSEVLRESGAQTVSRLEARLGALPPGCADPRWRGEVRLIAAELCGERKAVLPKDAALYWAHRDEVDPAELIRASMSIPFFFQPFTVEGPPASAGRPVPGQPRPVRHPIFVDGGLVSNFPIAEFHRDDQLLPDAPTFGVRLLSLRERREDEDPRPPKDVFRFVAALINTARHALDRSFIAENPEYARLVQVVDTGPHDWLAFDMRPEDQADLFGRGVEAAVAFLEGFEWSDYLAARRAADGERQRLQVDLARSGRSASPWVSKR